MIIDDLDGSIADETTRFALDGITYEIDLSKRHAKQLRDALSKYTAAGRRLPRTARHRSGQTRTAPSNESAAIRAWAAENGLELSARGRIPATVRQAYSAATTS